MTNTAPHLGMTLAEARAAIDAAEANYRTVLGMPDSAQINPGGFVVKLKWNTVLSVQAYGTADTLLKATRFYVTLTQGGADMTELGMIEGGRITTVPEWLNLAGHHALLVKSEQLLQVIAKITQLFPVPLMTDN